MDGQGTMVASGVASGRVRRRRVFYIPGYDPFHPRRYRELYRREGRAQAAISGYEISQKPRAVPGGYGWTVAARMGAAAPVADPDEGTAPDGDATVRSAIEVLVWSDLVRLSMSASIPATYLQLVCTAWIYLSTGTLWRLMRLRKGPTIAALYPVAVLLAQAALALALGRGVAAAIPATLSSTGAGWLVSLAGWTAGAGAAWGLLRWFRAQDRWLFAHYLMHDYAFSAQLSGAYPSDLEARLAAFGDQIAAALDSEVDEVLVVGHSSGAHLAVSILADLLRAGRVAPDGPALGLLTLGQVVPMVSFLPAAHRLRADLRALSTCDAVTWIDVSAPGDGCAFALCDPVAVTGVAPETGKRWPLVLSAAFTQTLSPARWKALRRRFFRLHFQYLCAFDRPGDYDYFAITAGPQTLRARYADRAPSASRIERAVSRFTSLAA